MKTKSIKHSIQQGFSLVELLVVIAVIAIIAAIAIPNIANITQQATIAKDRRNAQNIASVASAAKAAGVEEDLYDVDDTVALLIDTANPLTNSTGMKFGISELSTEEVAGAKDYLSDNSQTDGAILYNPGS